MPKNMRLKAAVSTAVLAGTLATPLLEDASAATTVPTLPDLTATLSNAGVSSSTVTTIEGELASLQSLAPGSTDAAGSLSAIDGVVTTLDPATGPLGGILAGLVSSLESTSDPAGTTNLSSLMQALYQVATSSGVSAPSESAVSALDAVLDTADLGQLLSPFGSASAVTSAISQLAGLQSLPLGGSGGSGSLSSVASLLTGAAGTSELPTPTVANLTNASEILGSNNPISPTELLSAITDIQSALADPGQDTTLVGPLTALADQLSNSSSIFGGVESLGSMLRPSTAATGLSELGGLANLIPGSSVSPGSLTSIATVLTTVADEPGLSGTPAANPLLDAAATMNGSSAIDPTTLLSTISSLNGASGSLPAPFDTLVSGIAEALGNSGSVFGAIPALTPAQVTSALSTLSSLPSLTAGSPTGSLAPVGTLLSVLAGEPGISGTTAATTLTELASAVSSGSLTPTQLVDVLGGLDSAQSGVPTSYQMVLGEIIDQLGSSGSIFGSLGLSTSQLSAAFGALQSLPMLASGASIPAGTLSPLATILTTVGAQSTVPAEDKALLDDLADVMDGGVSPSTLLSLVKDLGTISEALPSPLSGIVGDLTSQLATSGSLTGLTATTTGTTGTTDTASKPTASELAAYEAYLAKEKAALKAAAAKSGYLTIQKIKRNGRTLIVTVHCTASASKECRASLTATEHSHRLSSKSLTVRGDKTEQVRLTMPVSATIATDGHASRESVTVTAKSGSKKVSKVVRFLTKK